MKEVKVRNFKYEIIKNIDSCLNIEELDEKVTDYFDSFDYIFGDYSYDKLRLKGFNDKNAKNFSKVNDIKGLDSYIKEYCSYGAKYFLLKKIK